MSGRSLGSRGAVIGSVLGLVATLAACGSSSSGTSGAGTSSSGSGSGSSSGAAASTPAGNGHTITAIETEFKINLSATSVPAGTYTFVAKNMGKDTHALTVDGAGVEDKTTGDIQPGQSKSVTVTLSKGTYDIYCPVANHKMLGMNDSLSVT